MKPPDHPVPSGDRRVAELLVAALQHAGHPVELASSFQSYESRGDGARQIAIMEAGRAEAARLAADLAARPPALRPALWFTYHVYYKSPDWLGPAVARNLGIPYVIAEPSYSPKRAAGAFAAPFAAAKAAIAGADALFCPTRVDMAALAPIAAASRLHYLPPFLDPAPYVAASANRGEIRAALAAEHRIDPGKVWLVAVGMMRKRDKLESYRRLAAALHRLPRGAWRLLIAGDGKARGEVRAAFASFGTDVTMLGALGPEPLARLYAAGDICVWPAAGEAYGMALLEAQAAGLPVIAGSVGGVPDVVKDGETGLLAAAGDAADFAAKLGGLLDDADRRERFGAAARRFVTGERNLDVAAARLDGVLRALRP
ncbi:MAG TPA: glycosyltransferase family 4 protein [Candidatus Cybelea sp.]|nr:glycosyltransferase family 4 protein [Candidatus Cybelea sp.]